MTEGTGSNPVATFTIQRVGNLSGQAIVNWTTADGTATAGADYVAASGQVVFANGESRKTVGITVIGDSAVEPQETFNLVLTAVTPGYAVGAAERRTGRPATKGPRSSTTWPRATRTRRASPTRRRPARSWAVRQT